MEQRCINELYPFDQLYEHGHIIMGCSLDTLGTAQLVISLSCKIQARDDVPVTLDDVYHEPWFIFSPEFGTWGICFIRHPEPCSDDT